MRIRARQFCWLMFNVDVRADLNTYDLNCNQTTKRVLLKKRRVSLEVSNDTDEVLQT